MRLLPFFVRPAMLLYQFIQSAVFFVLGVIALCIFHSGPKSFILFSHDEAAEFICFLGVVVVSSILILMIIAKDWIREPQWVIVAIIAALLNFLVSLAFLYFLTISPIQAESPPYHYVYWFGANAIVFILVAVPRFRKALLVKYDEWAERMEDSSDA